MAVNNPRFRVYRGRVMGPDLANIHSVGVQLTSDIEADLGAVPTAGSEHGYFLNHVSIDNGAASHVFLGGRIPAANFTVAGWTGNVDTTGIDATDDKSRNLVINTQYAGFAVHADRRFNTIVIDIDVGAQGDITDEFSYWNGSSWTALAQKDILCAVKKTGTENKVGPTFEQGRNCVLTTNATIAANSIWEGEASDTGKLLLIFRSPDDWTATTAGQLTNVGVGRYVLRYRNTRAAAVSRVATSTGADGFKIGCATRSVFWSLGDVVNGVDLNIPLTSVDEVPWVIWEKAGAAETADHKISVTLERTAYTGKLGV